MLSVSPHPNISWPKEWRRNDSLNAAFTDCMDLWLQLEGKYGELPGRLSTDLKNFFDHESCPEGGRYQFGQDELVCCFFNYCDWEDCDYFGIEQFRPDEKIIFYSYDSAFHHQAVAYPIEEAQGMIAYGIAKYCELYPNLREESIRIQSQFYDVEKVLEKLQAKIDGVVPWECRGVGKFSKQE